jgi:hypothetical protein
LPRLCGLPKSIDTAIRTPHGRSASAIFATSGRYSGDTTRRSAFTLLMETPLIPTDAGVRNR